MNGVHDMGGLQDMGPVQIEKNEPVFHEWWEGRVYAMTRALRFWNKWNIDSSRWATELIPPAEYFRMSYYEKWHAGMVRLLVNSKLVTAEEIEHGMPADGSAKATPPLTAGQVDPLFTQDQFGGRNRTGAPARFQVGQRVRARNMHPLGHNRLPRYARGRFGTIDRNHGVFSLPDTNATFLGENPQHVYSVRFTARELWGDQAPAQDAVYIDMWDNYLEPA